MSKHLTKSPKCRSSSSQAGASELVTPDEENDLLNVHMTNNLRAKTAEFLQHLRYDKNVADNFVDELKPLLSSTRRMEIDTLRQQLLPLLQPGKEQEVEHVLATIEDPFYGLTTAKRERDYAVNVQKLSVLKPRIRNLQKPGEELSYKDAKNHGSVGFCVIEALTVLMQNDSAICKEIIAKSDDWKTGRLRESEADELADETDGEIFREHPISRRADASEADTVRIGLRLYNDGVTVSHAHETLTMLSHSPTLVSCPIPA